MRCWRLSAKDETMTDVRIDDETLYAWLDGELPEDEAKRVAALVAANPMLGKKLEAQRQLQAQLRAAFDPVAAAPMPAGIHAAASAEQVSSLASARAKRAGRTGFGLPQWSAVAAAVVAGFICGQMVPRGDTAAQDGLVASAQLTEALDSQLASADRRGDGAGVHVRLTFRDVGGNLCRSFETPSTAGVACREKGTWDMRALVARQPHAQSDYRMATSGDAAILAYIDAQISGDPLDAAAEKRAMQSDWKTH
jgi:hypothetical protein